MTCVRLIGMSQPGSRLAEERDGLAGRSSLKSVEDPCVECVE